MLVNHTLGTLEVRCSPGGDGGSPQRFVAKVFASPTNTQLAKLEALQPKFHVTGLVPGQDYLVTITAVNDKGSSEPEQIDAIRLKVNSTYYAIELYEYVFVFYYIWTGFLE